MTTGTARLIVLLRVAYITGAALFLVDVLINVALQVLIRTGQVPYTEPKGPIFTAMDWIAIIAFVLAAIGALATVIATSELTRQSGGDSFELDDTR
ncbi:hypothetical protein SCB71_14245 [Herbiconiux sp. KACC 21604]|uniref:hypothetical protein n=1 Tax=unclassified Herbiconiux TaxID=2618217 RepID=UPI00149260F8|nr:hypothetical protein [Herbiconiux sp. SALV-R1]QJU54302.1 hypothetical protein HL652_12185 [Herbiconiux sp. SALV-R1]WPO85372.1 hypothetical protein SCB71_14245 [Herbiconiux sp. KACC 21604]